MSDVEALVESIQALVQSSAEVDSFLDKLHALVANAPMSLGSTYEPGVELYRATKQHRAVPVRVDDLSHPPVEVTPPGRANRRGAPMFYCSSDPNCACREVAAQVGQLVVLAKWVTSRPMVLHDLGYTSQVLNRAGSRRALPANHRSFYEASLNENGRKVRDFLALAFTEPTPLNYSLTTAIAEFHLRGNQCAGILYPSVSKAANVDNLALLPGFVQEGLRLVAAQLLSIDQIDADGSIRGDVLADMSSVEADGTLRWAFREGGAQVPPGGGYAFRAGDSFRVQSAGEIEVEGQRYLVDTGYSIESTESGEVTVRNLRGEVVEPISSAV